MSRPLAQRAGDVPWGLLAAACAYVAVRLLVLHTSFNEVALWMYELYPMGTLAELANRDVHLPIHLFYDNAAGQILAGYLAVPAFLVLGPSYLALKLVPFLMGIGALVLVYSFLRESFGRVAANVGAWLAVLPATTLFKYSLVCSGNHFENVFFTALALFAFYRLHERGVTARRLFLLGLAAGVALLAFLGALIPLAILLAMHLGIRRVRPALRDLRVVALGFLLGISPLIALNARTQGRALGFLEAKFGDEDGARVAVAPFSERIHDYFAVSLPRAPKFPDFGSLDSATLGWVLTAALAIAWLACLPFALRGIASLARGALARTSGVDDAAGERARFERAKLVPMVLYLPLSALAFGISNLRIDRYEGPLGFSGYRYYLPWFLFGMLGVAALCGLASRGRTPWRCGAILLFSAAFLPGLSNLLLVDWSFSHTGLGARCEGYDLPKVARGLLSTRNALDRATLLEYLGRFPPLLSARVTRAIGFYAGTLAAEEARKNATPADRAWSIDLDALVLDYPEERHSDLARGAGSGLRFVQVVRGGDAGELDVVLLRTLERASTHGRAIYPFLLEGLATRQTSLPLAEDVGGTLVGTNGLIGRCVSAHLPHEIPEGLARGQGFFCGRLLRRGIGSDIARVVHTALDLPEDLHPAFFRGLGMGCAEAGESPGPPTGFHVPPKYRGEYWLGFVAMLRDAYGAQASELALGIRRDLPLGHRMPFDRALAAR